jgi:hypothetical protein
LRWRRLGMDEAKNKTAGTQPGHREIASSQGDAPLLTSARMRVVICSVREVVSARYLRISPSALLSAAIRASIASVRQGGSCLRAGCN